MIVIAWMVLALAQDSMHAAQPVELADLYHTAQAHSPRIAAAHALASATRARTASARRPPDPTVQFGYMNYELPHLRAMDGIGMAQLQVMQMLPVAGKLGLAWRVASATADAQGERARDVDWEVRSKVAMSFYDLYTIDRSLAIDRDAVRLLQDLLRTAESMYRVGEGRQADVLRAQVEMARMAQDTLRMTAMRTAMMARLGAVMELPPSVLNGQPVLPAFPDSVPPLEAVVSAANDGRPMLRAGSHDLEAATLQLSASRREIWPDLTVGVQYGQRGGVDGTERMGSLMISANVPLFARSRQLRMREEALAMQQVAEADLSAMRAETRAAVIELHANLVRARTMRTLYRTTLLPQAEAVTASSLAAYRVGIVDFMTQLDNRMSLNRYRKELITLEADEGKAWAELEMLAGRELFVAWSADRRRSPEEK
jgi:cobalt-zinc-cadmium efflux system outer membrane protein